MRKEIRKILVCGGRDFTDQDVVNAVLDEINPDCVVSGGARGADRCAEIWAFSRKRMLHVVRAEWKKYGKSAGIRRNAEMLKLHPDISEVIAFPGGVGTAHMVFIARKAGFNVREIGG